MGRVVAWLRGVNVGGRQLPMATLRSGLIEFGCTDVATYIQSGNVVLTPPSVEESLDAWLSECIGEIADFDVPTVTRTTAELDVLVAGNPYPSASGTQLHVVFFGAAPPAAVFETVEPASVTPEEWTIAGRDLYLHLPNGMGRALLPVALEKAGRRLKAPPGTSRNWNTVCKMRAMLHD